MPFPKRAWKGIYVKVGHEEIVDQVLEQLRHNFPEAAFDYDVEWEKVEEDEDGNPEVEPNGG